MRTNQHGLAWTGLGIIRLTTCYRYTQAKKYLDQAQKVYNFIFTNKTCRKTSFLTGITMLRTFRMNLVMPPLQHVRLLLCMNSTAICRGNHYKENC